MFQQKGHSAIFTKEMTNLRMSRLFFLPIGLLFSLGSTHSLLVGPLHHTLPESASLLSPSLSTATTSSNLTMISRWQHNYPDDSRGVSNRREAFLRAYKCTILPSVCLVSFSPCFSFPAAAERESSRSLMIDTEYPGTAVERMIAIRERVSSLGDSALNGPWTQVRKKILFAGGLRDLENAAPGRGYTGHSFNDYNHVDLTAMREIDNRNDGSVKDISVGNSLGDGIRIASLPELGPGGSWSTCAIGCSKNPPQDVAHVQFRSRIAFKLVWVPNKMYDTFVLVDDSGKLLAKGTPAGGPPLEERMINYQMVTGSKYAIEADKLVSSM